MATLVLDRAGVYDLGEMLGGDIPVSSQRIEVTAPDVEIRGLSGTDLRRSADQSQSDSAWSAFVRVRSSAARCRIVDSSLDDVDTIGVHCSAPGLQIIGSKITNMGAGVYLEGAAVKSARIIDSAIHKANRMLRNTVGGSDDCGAMCVVAKRTPRVTDPAERNVVRNVYMGDAVAWSNDYAWGEGAAVEVYEGSSLEVVDSVILDVSVGLETGSKVVQVADVHFNRTLIGALETIADEKFRRGLGFRPVSDSSVTDCGFFDLDHWDQVIGWPSGTFAYGVNANFRMHGNRHACTRNGKAYSYGGAGGTGYTIDTASETVLYGTAANALATQLRTEATSRRDAILAIAGLKDTPAPETDARLAAIEAGLHAAIVRLDQIDGLAAGTIRSRVTALEGDLSEDRAAVHALELEVDSVQREVDSLEAIGVAHEGRLDGLAMAAAG